MSELQTIDDDIWMVEGPNVSFYGFPYPTRMVIVRLDGGLWVWSPIELDEELEATVRGLGEVRWVVSPNKLHHLFIPDWLEAFDEAEAFAPPGLAQKRDDIDFAAELGDEAPAGWDGVIDQIVFRGSSVMQEVLFFHRPSSTCLVGDLIQRQEPEHYKGWQRAVMKLDGMTGPDGSTPREWRASFVHRDQAREALDAAMAWEPRRLIIAHGECAMENGAEVLHDNLAWVAKSWPV